MHGSGPLPIVSVPPSGSPRRPSPRRLPGARKRADGDSARNPRSTLHLDRDHSGLFCALRASEYLSTAPDRGLRRNDLHLLQAHCRARLHVQKNHQHGAPTWVTAPANGGDICPVRSLRAYCAARDQRHAAGRPLFILQDGRPLSPSHLTEYCAPC